MNGWLQRAHTALVSPHSPDHPALPTCSGRAMPYARPRSGATSTPPIRRHRIPTGVPDSAVPIRTSGGAVVAPGVPTRSLEIAPSGAAPCVSALTRKCRMTGRPRHQPTGNRGRLTARAVCPRWGALPALGSGLPGSVGSHVRQTRVVDRDRPAKPLLPHELEPMLARLDADQRRVMTLRLGLDRGEPRTLEEVAQETGLLRDRVHQIEVLALEIMRQRGSPEPE
jgi:hypothetical protein